MSDQASSPKRLAFFERYLTIWALVCMVVCLAFGKLLPAGLAFKQSDFRQDAFLSWEPETGSGFGFNDGSSYSDPAVDGGVGKRHGKAGGIVLNISSSVIFMKEDAWRREATDQEMIIINDNEFQRLLAV